MIKKILYTLFIPLFAITVHANTIIVDSTNNAGTGSLRLAISMALNGDTIRFNPYLIRNGSDSIVLDSSITFSKDLIIIGSYTATDTLFISGGQNNKIFDVTNTTFISLDSMVLMNADTIALELYYVDSVFLNHSIFRNNNGFGAFVYSIKKLRIDNCSFHKNTSMGLNAHSNYPISNMNLTHISNSSFNRNGIGGLTLRNADSLSFILDNCFFHQNLGFGVFFNTSRIDGLITNCAITDNTSVGDGGGIMVYTNFLFPYEPCSRKLKIINTTISNNQARYRGGGISLFFKTTYLFYGAFNQNIQIIDSEISNNSVTDSLGQGGAIHLEIESDNFQHFHNELQILNTTISGNHSPFQGGGIFYKDNAKYPSDSTVINIQNTTLADNDAPAGGAIYMNTGGSVANVDLNIQSSIVAFNGDTNIHRTQNPVITSGGYNIFSDSVLSGTVSSDILHVDATSLNLKSLSFNGGQTQTMMPMIPSIAKDNGNPTDTSDAQNLPIFGNRDVGAAEVCYSLGFDSVITCQEYTWTNHPVFYTDTTVTDTLISSMGCDSVVTLDLTINDVDTLVTINYLTLMAQASNATFQWLDCASFSNLQDSTFASFTASENGSYAVEIIQNGCIDTSNCNAITNVGIADHSVNNVVSIFPNPVEDRLNIDMINPLKNRVQLDIINANGQTVYTTTYLANSKQFEHTVNTQNLSPGIYFIRIKTSSQLIHTKRFIKR